VSAGEPGTFVVALPSVSALPGVAALPGVFALASVAALPALYYVCYPSKMMNVQKSPSDLSATASLNRATSLVDYHRVIDWNW
jgi:hypothetical protein